MVCPLEITTLSVMKHFMILIVLLIIPFTINAQESDTKVGVIMVGLVINNNEFATSLQTRCFEIYKYQNFHRKFPSCQNHNRTAKWIYLQSLLNHP